MKKLISAAASVLIAVSFTNLALADHVRRDYDHNRNFSYIRTFSFGEVKTSDPAFEDLLKGAMGEALSAKGWNLVSSGAK
jgi:hypothetical protein